MKTMRLCNYQIAVQVLMPITARLKYQPISDELSVFCHLLKATIIWMLMVGLYSEAQAAPQGGPSTDSRIKIQYRELVDDWVYGHSGRPASEILEQLELSTPRGIARAMVSNELEERANKLAKEIVTAAKSKNADLLKKRAELNRIETILDDHSLLGKEIDSYLEKNKAEVEMVAQLASGRMKGLLSDVEPVCEPAAFILNDALAQKDPKTFNPDLTELAVFYPNGEAEPAWADLIRTRRFVVYTDGRSYCRLFLPGLTSEQAWKEAFPVVRHILLSLLKQDSGSLDIDVYAYTNDIASTIFTLDSQKRSMKVLAQDLATPTGLKSLDMVALRKFFADGLTLEGCGVDAGGQLVLIGSKRKQPTLEGHPIELSDLAVAYRASAYAGHGESYMSLDKAPDDKLVNVNFGGRLHDTRMGWVAYRCDLRFKTIGDDYDAVTFEHLTQKIVTAIPDFESRRKRKCSTDGFRDIAIEGTRFWFYPDDFKVVSSRDGKSCLVARPRFTAAAERQEAFGNDGKKLDSKTPSWTSLTLDHFNKNYDKFATLFPEVAELDDAARLLGVAEWLHQAKLKGTLPSDIDQLLSVELPVNPTPRSREQLKIKYAIKKTGIPAEFKAYCISTPRGAFEFERDVKQYEKPASEWELISVTGGGLDYSARKAVEQSVKANVAEESFLLKAMAGKDPFPGAAGRTWKSSKIWETKPASGGKGPPQEPPLKGYVSASAPEPGPKGNGFGATSRRYRNARGKELDEIDVQEKGVRRVQTSDAEMFYKDGSMHSVWIGEHGIPDRFATKTSEGVIAYTLVEKDGVMAAKRVTTQRTPSEAEVDFLAAAILEKKGAPSEVWNMTPIDADIRAVDFTPEKEALVCYRGKAEDVVGIYKEGAAAKVLKGPSAMTKMHAASREKVKAFSIPGKVELLHIASDERNIVLQIGRRDPIRLAKTEWGKWLAQEGESTPPAALAEVYNDLLKSDAELVVMRDALQSKPRRLKFKESPSFKELNKEFNDAEIEILKLSVEELDFRITELKKFAEKVEGLESYAMNLELSMLERTKTLSPTEKTVKISKLEAANQEMLVEQIVVKTEHDAVALAGVLKNKFQKLRVSYDDPSLLVPERVLREPLVKVVSDVGLAIPPGEAGVDDKGILRTVAATFEQAKIPLIKSPADLEKVGNVIVISAHNNEALFNYIEALGSYQINGKSALDGKFLMLTTCFEEGNPNMISELLRRYNCAGVHVQSERVNKDAVRRALTEFGNALRDMKPNEAGKRLRDIYDDAIRRVLKSDDPGVEFLKEELEKLLRARVQWCMAPIPLQNANV